MESIVLVDETGYASGTAAKAAVHHAQTPLHLAFSCYLFNGAGQFLLTRRAESKRTWPGVWTNTCCGHPLPGESLSGSVLRRLRDELGIGSAALTLVLPGFRPDPAEVAEARWVDWAEFCAAVRAARQPISPWCAMQLTELAGLGPRPLDWIPGDPAGLPPAALG